MLPLLIRIYLSPEIVLLILSFFDPCCQPQSSKTPTGKLSCEQGQSQVGRGDAIVVLPHPALVMIHSGATHLKVCFRWGFQLQVEVVHPCTQQGHTGRKNHISVIQWYFLLTISFHIYQSASFGLKCWVKILMFNSGQKWKLLYLTESVLAVNSWYLNWEAARGLLASFHNCQVSWHWGSYFNSK